MKSKKTERYSQKGNTHNTYYENLLAASDIGEIAQELIPDRITDEDSDKLYCDCPNHASTSGKSLHIDLEKQLWNCFGCGIGGNIIHFVEFIQTGQVSTGIKGRLPESHCRARDFLAERAKMPLLAHSNRSPEEIKALEQSQQQDSRTYDCLTAIANYYHDQLKLHPDALAWVLDNYAISEETISQLKIGFSANGSSPDGLIEKLKSDGFTEEEMLSTGAFRENTGGPFPLFRERITFPYWSRNLGVVYMIGRKTPWTPENKYEIGKYKKLMVHSDKHSYVRECVNNSFLYNEDCLADKPSMIVITEGITDAISAIERGFSVVSPVTVRVRKEDQDRLCDKLRGFSGKVIVVQDKEISQAGLQGSLDTARLLLKSGVNARIAELALGDKQKEARKTLLDKYGIDENTPAIDRNKKIEGITDETQKEEISDLLKDAKIDINEYFRDGHSIEDFQRILNEALTPLEWSIASLNPELPIKERSEKLESILTDINLLDPSQQEFYLRKIKDLLGDTSLDTLKKHLNKAKKQNQGPDEEKKSQFNKLFGLFYHSGSSALSDQFNLGWATMKIGDHFENVPINSGKFKGVMLDLYYREYHESVDFRTIELFGALLTERPTEKRYLYNRYAWIEDRLLIDMCEDDWKAIEVSEEGWKIVETDKPVFKRFSHQRPLAAPKKGGDIKRILKYLAINDEGNQALLLVWLCTCMLEFAPRPGLILHGLQGSSKTSATDFLRMIVDPSAVMHSSLSKDLTEFVQRMDHHAVVSLDNLSSIPQWASDALCGSTTGAGFQKRMLYTDDDDITYFFRRVFMLNGISIPTNAPDLLDRCITIELTRINTKVRKRESKLKKEFEADIPDILGGVLDVMVQVIARKDEELEEYPRLADWFGLGYLAAEVLDVKEAFLKAFKRSEKEQHKEVVESHVVTELLVEFMENKDSWDGKKSEIYHHLSEMAEERKLKANWPKTTSTFGKQLKKLYHNLEEIGIHCEDSNSGKERRFSITKIEPVEAETKSDDLRLSIVENSGFDVNAVSNGNDSNGNDISNTAVAKPTVRRNGTAIDPFDGEISSKELAQILSEYMPAEVCQWNDILQELFCEHTDWNVQTGMSEAEAGQEAIKTVKKCAEYARWNK